MARWRRVGGWVEVEEGGREFSGEEGTLREERRGEEGGNRNQTNSPLLAAAVVILQRAVVAGAAAPSLFVFLQPEISFFFHFFITLFHCIQYRGGGKGFINLIN
jgi:hypothetical protein